MLECINTGIEVSYDDTECPVKVGDFVSFVILVKNGLSNNGFVAKILSAIPNPYTKGNNRSYGRIIRSCSFIAERGIRLGIIENTGSRYHPQRRYFFTPSSLIGRNEFTQGDYVTFEPLNQPSTDKSIAGKAVMIEAEANPSKGVVVLMKSSYGFLEDIHSKAQYFFTASNTEDFNKLRVGAVVLYNLEYQPRIKKHNAINLRRIGAEPSVELRLTSNKFRTDRRLKAFSSAATHSCTEPQKSDPQDCTTDFVRILREPRNPDASRKNGFSYIRLPRAPGDITTLERCMQLTKTA
ncbi:hypothetical protein ACOME3_009836 [Neoechinorhynchus agilis]